MKSRLLTVVMISHLVAGGLWGWPLGQSTSEQRVLLSALEEESHELRQRLTELPLLEVRVGRAFEASRSAQSLEAGERFHRLASALTEWSDLAEVEVTALRAVENTDTRLALEAEVQGPSASVIKWIELAERAMPPVHVTDLSLRRVATHVVASLKLEAIPAVHFDSPPTSTGPSWPVDPFRKDP